MLASFRRSTATVGYLQPQGADKSIKFSFKFKFHKYQSLDRVFAIKFLECKFISERLVPGRHPAEDPTQRKFDGVPGS